jgi:hypothetical protein
MNQKEHPLPTNKLALQRGKLCVRLMYHGLADAEASLGK